MLNLKTVLSVAASLGVFVGAALTANPEARAQLGKAFAEAKAAAQTWIQVDADANAGANADTQTEASPGSEAEAQGSADASANLSIDAQVDLSANGETGFQVEHNLCAIIAHTALLTWDVLAADGSTYLLYRNGQLIGTLDANSRSYLDLSVQSGEAIYTLQFTNEAGAQTEVVATAPGC